MCCFIPYPLPCFVLLLSVTVVVYGAVQTQTL